jgi:hypothetical protein
MVKDRVLKIIINRTFIAPTGTMYTFLKNGIGEKFQASEKLPFLWTVDDAGIVKFTGRITANEPDKNLFFDFTQKTGYVYGYSEQSMTFPLQVKK